jgi:hypothetical protein
MIALASGNMARVNAAKQLVVRQAYCYGSATPMRDKNDSPS